MKISGYNPSLNVAENDTHPQTYKLTGNFDLDIIPTDKLLNKISKMWFDFEETLPIPPKGHKYTPDIEWEKENDGNYKIIMIARLKPIIRFVED